MRFQVVRKWSATVVGHEDHNNIFNLKKTQYIFTQYIFFLVEKTTAGTGSDFIISLSPWTGH